MTEPDPVAANVPLETAVEEETVDGLPVLAQVRPVQAPAEPIGSGLSRRTGLPTVQAAAAAATGFVAGAATVALVRRRAVRRMARAPRVMPRRPLEGLPIAGSRTFLVDVHLIAKPGE